MGPQPVVTGLSPKEGPPGTRITIRGEFLGTKPSDLLGLSICGSDCLLSAEWKSPNKIIARTGPAKGKGDIIVATLSGGIGTSTVQFRAYHETIGPMKPSAVWVDESPTQIFSWGRRSLSPTSYSHEDPLGLSIEGNDKKFNEDLRDIFPDGSGDLSNENFSPGWFLLEHHHGTSFDDLKAGLLFLKRKVENQKEGQLSFLKSNTGSVIDQLDTLMYLRDKYSEDEKAFGKEPIKSLELDILRSLQASNLLFDGILTRRESADSIRGALMALYRHKFLFCLPNSIDKSAQKEDYDIVVNDYIRAKNLFGKSDLLIFKKVLEEIDNRVAIIKVQLEQKILKMPQTLEQQKKYIKALINLERTSTTPSSDFDPAWQAIETRTKYLEETFKLTFDQYTSKEVQPSPSKARDSETLPNRVLFCEELCDIATNQLPDIWRLGQAYFAGELKGFSDPRPEHFKRMILNQIDQYCNFLRAAILPGFGHKGLLNTKNVQWPNTSSSVSQFLPWLPTCLRYVRVFYVCLIRLDMPNEALDIIQALIASIRLFCMSNTLKIATDKVKKLEERETWDVADSEFAGITPLPHFLKQIIVEALDECHNTCLVPELREGSIMEANSDGQREISQKLQDIFNKFCGVIETLAYDRENDDSQASTISQMIGFPYPSAKTDWDGESMRGSTPWEQKLLCCLANCAYCYQTFFSQLGTIVAKYGFVFPKIAVESGRGDVHLLFNSLLEAYVEHKCDPLVGTIEPSMYIAKFQWDNVKNVVTLRPYANECCNNMIGVFSELLTISPFLLRPVLEPIVQTVAEELSRLMSCVQKFNTNGAIQANVDIILLRDAFKSYSNENGRMFFAEALDAIPTLTPDNQAQVQQIVSRLKKEMKLQLMCFNVKE